MFVFLKFSVIAGQSLQDKTKIL